MKCYMTPHGIFNRLHKGRWGFGEVHIYILFMFPKDTIALISAKYAHQSKQNTKQATTVILGLSVCQIKMASSVTEVSTFKPCYFLLCYSVNSVNPRQFSTKIQHNRAALVSELSHWESRLHITNPAVFSQNTQQRIYSESWEVLLLIHHPKLKRVKTNELVYWLLLGQ